MGADAKLQDTVAAQGGAVGFLGGDVLIARLGSGLFRKTVDVVAVAGVGGDTAGGGVGLGDVAGFLKASHFGTDGGRGNLEELGESNAADRGGEFGVFLNDGKKNLFLARS